MGRLIRFIVFFHLLAVAAVLGWGYYESRTTLVLKPLFEENSELKRIREIGREDMSRTLLAINTLPKTNLNKVDLAEESNMLVAMGSSFLMLNENGLSVSDEKLAQMRAQAPDEYQKLAQNSLKEARKNASFILSEALWSVLYSGLKHKARMEDGAFDENLLRKAADIRTEHLMGKGQVVVAVSREDGLAVVLLGVRLNGTASIAEALGYKKVVFEQNAWYRIVRLYWDRKVKG